MTGYKTLKEKDTEKKRGKRRFIERLVEEEEADKLIKEFYEGSTDEGGADRRDGERPERGERGEGFVS
jgi:hypothetical protein